eukprot:Rhum_TRINITY_DN14292_c5_g2::Rhum_TRINITY_DN14292_c5_g2_i1::g.78147::m.78147
MSLLRSHTYGFALPARVFGGAHPLRMHMDVTGTCGVHLTRLPSEGGGIFVFRTRACERNVPGWSAVPLASCTPSALPQQALQDAAGLHRALQTAHRPSREGHQSLVQAASLLTERHLDGAAVDRDALPLLLAPRFLFLFGREIPRAGSKGRADRPDVLVTDVFSWSHKDMCLRRDTPHYP